MIVASSGRVCVQREVRRVTGQTGWVDVPGLESVSVVEGLTELAKLKVMIRAVSKAADGGAMRREIFGSAWRLAVYGRMSGTLARVIEDVHVASVPDAETEVGESGRVIPDWGSEAVQRAVGIG
jgi:hypothetical protein